MNLKDEKSNSCKKLYKWFCKGGFGKVATGMGTLLLGIAAFNTSFKVAVKCQEDPTLKKEMRAERLSSETESIIGSQQPEVEIKSLRNSKEKAKFGEVYIPNNQIQDVINELRNPALSTDDKKMILQKNLEIKGLEQESPYKLYKKEIYFK